MKSLPIRPSTKSIKTSRSFSFDSNGLWKMPCDTAGSPYLPKSALLKQTQCSFLEIRYLIRPGAHCFLTPVGLQTGSAGKGLLEGLG